MNENILQEADKLTSQDRRREYGPASEEFERAAAMWSTLLKKKLKEPITADEYAMCMVLVKVIRYSYKSSRDSLIDIAGYARTIEMLGEETTDQFFQSQYESTQTSVRQNYDPTSGPCPQCKRCLCLKCKNWHEESKCRPLAVTPAMPSCGDQRILVGPNISAEHAEAAGYTRRHVSVEEMHKAQLSENSELAGLNSNSQSGLGKKAWEAFVAGTEAFINSGEVPKEIPANGGDEAMAAQAFIQGSGGVAEKLLAEKLLNYPDYPDDDDYLVRLRRDLE